MMNKNLLRDDGGYALYMTIVLIGVLMIGGVLLSNTTITDLAIVRNNIVYSQNLAAAESAAMTAIQTFEPFTEVDRNTINPLPGAISSLETSGVSEWINTYENITNPADENSTANEKYWKTMTLDKLASRASAENAKIKYRAVKWQPAKGSPLGAHNESIVYECAVRGAYYSPKYGATNVEMGYKKRF